MLMVLMVLLMTTATATFAIHSTSMEMRAAGHSRTAMQTAYVAEGGAYATLAYMDATGAQGVFVQYIRTRVNANQQISPNEATIDQDTNLLRVEMDDFASAPGVVAPPIETDYARTPSFGPRSANVANFTADVVDVHDAGAAARPGSVGSAEGQFRFVRINLTSRGRMAPPGDITVGADPRTFHQSSANARAVGLIGPFAGGG